MKPSMLAHSTTPRSRRTVLVADDSSSVRRALEFALEPRYRVVTAASGPEAIRLCRERRPDLALLDLMMPEATGIDVLAAVLYDERPPKVVFLTAVNDCKIAANAMKLGAADYLVKPCSPSRIRRTIARLLG